MAENEIMTLDEYLAWPQEYITSGGLEEGEIRYKIRLADDMAKAREAVLTGASNWREILKPVYRRKHNNLIDWRDEGVLSTWVDGNPDDALDAMRALWAEEDTPISDRIISDRIKDFVPRVQPPHLPDGPSYHDNFNGTGTRLRLIAALLMALDPLQYPPFKTTEFRNAYKRTGHPMPPKGADEADTYKHALEFLDKLVERAAALGLAGPKNRLEAQSIVWSYQWPEERFGPRDQDSEDDGSEEGVTAPETASLQELADELMFDVEFLERVEQLLEDKRQVIFQGPPGTGKTYTAKKLAACLAGSKERVRLVQFHSSYAYEDFVQGFRPRLIGGQPGFELKDGPLLEMAEMARKEPEDVKHFLVIDEINRGNLAKVFGELYFLLEYRDEKMRLQYSESGETFDMPENLYIIGTMNTADRSIALVDLALRRRFYFVEFRPDKDPVKGLLGRWLDANNPDMAWAAGIVDRANEMLADREAAIGPSYLMKDKLDEEKAKRIWEHNVLPYVEEHLYGQTDRLDEFGFDKLRGKSDSGGESDEVEEDGGDDESADESDDA